MMPTFYRIFNPIKI